MAEAWVWIGREKRRLDSGRLEKELAELGKDASAVLLKNGEREVFVTSGAVRPPRNVTAVSCGLSERDSVSVSSQREDSVVLSVRRRLPSVTGEDICIQDIALSCGGDMAGLALKCAALLCLGVSPKKMEKLL